MKRKSIIPFVTALAVVVTAFGGCGQKNENPEGAKIDFKSYPLEGEHTITLFNSLNATVGSMYENFGETAFAKELEKRTGIKVTYIHPPAGQEEQATSLMIASDEMADIMINSWSTYMGGPTKTISENVISELNGIIDEYAPNYKKYLSEHPEIDKAVKTDDGKYYSFPFLKEGKLLHKSSGLMVRRDWLNEFGLEIPESVEDMENVLRVFKEKKGSETPFSCTSYDTETLLGVFGTTAQFYLKDGKVVYGPATNEYRDALTVLNKWYKEGLFDANFVVNDKNALDALVLNDKCGMTIGSGGGYLGTWLDTSKNDKFDMVGIANPLMADGSVGYFEVQSPVAGYSDAAISAKSKNKELAAIFLDYAYSEEGNKLYNFGIEGVSYEMKDGVHTYTEEITANPNGLTMAQAMSNYFLASSSGPFVQHEDYIKGFYYRPQQRESLDNWLKYYDDVKNMRYPGVSYTQAEGTENANILSEVDKYVAKMRSEFILGTTDISEFDNYVKQLEKLNINKLIEIREAALERFNAR